MAQESLQAAPGGHHSTTVEQSRQKRPRRRHQRDVFRSRIVDGATFAGCMDLPSMAAIQASPTGLVPFSLAMQTSCRDYDRFVDFYEDDYEFERIWNDPFRYIDRLARFAGVIAPDFSTCWDFPVAMKAWNTYRNQALGSFLQRSGIPCIPNVRCEPEHPWMLDGIPHGSTVAIGARSCVKRVEDRRRFIEAVHLAVDTLEPSSIIWYGSSRFGVADYPMSLGIPMHFFPARMFRQA